MKNIALLFFIFFNTVLLSGCFEAESQPILEREAFVFKTQQGAVHVFNLEVADTLDEQMNGLMHRTSLEDDEGMVFPVEIPRIFNMWMRDTKIPLDMLFVDERGEITHVHWEAQPLSDEVITHAHPAKAVFELKGGVSLEKDINPGDFVFHEMFNNLDQLKKSSLPKTRAEIVDAEILEYKAFRKKAQEEAEKRAQEELKNKAGK